MGSVKSHVVVDLGSSTSQLEEALSLLDAVILLVEPDPLSVVRIARARRTFPVPVVAACAGRDEAGRVGEILEIPCYPVRRQGAGLVEADVKFILDALPRRSRAPLVYVVGGRHKELPSFLNVAEVVAAVDAHIPEAIAVHSSMPGALDFIRALRREKKLSCVPVGVLGSVGQDWYAAGADACYEVLDTAAIEDLLGRRKRMAELTDALSRDPLTGCLRREALDGLLAAQAARFFETRVPFSVLMLDLDRFKAVNDAYGHQAGDAVLAAFGEFLLSSVREVDHVVRYGGEEFLVVLPGAKVEQALEIGERLRAGWAAREIGLPGGAVIGSTLSGGAAEFGRHSLDVGSLIEAADRALYRVKEAGRDGVMVA